jgi:hypothetical protein
MVSDTVVVAAIVAVSSTCAPLFLAYLTAQQRRKERKEDFERQDRVAARAAEVAKRLLERDEHEHELSETPPGTNGYVSAAMRSEIDTLERAIALAEENLQLRVAAGHGPSPEAIRAIRYQKDRLALLEMRLADRERPQEEQEKIDENMLEREIKEQEISENA